jgi:hypothetical protein
MNNFFLLNSSDKFGKETCKIQNIILKVQDPMMDPRKAGQALTGLTIFNYKADSA